jgi:D-alanyl-D-alanine carboxypeptidase (penicillin-binding protein 5/6)
MFEVKTWLGTEDVTMGYTKEDVYVTIDKKDLRGFDVFLEYTGPVNAPIDKNEKIALIKVYNKKELVKTIPVYAFEKVKKINFLLSLLTSFNYMIWGDA